MNGMDMRSLYRFPEDSLSVFAYFNSKTELTSCLKESEYDKLAPNEQKRISCFSFEISRKFSSERNFHFDRNLSCESSETKEAVLSYL